MLQSGNLSVSKRQSGATMAVRARREDSQKCSWKGLRENIGEQRESTREHRGI